MTTLAHIMTSPAQTVDMDATLEHLRKLFDRHGFHHLIVVDRGRVVGVISDRDLLKNLSPYLGTFGETKRDQASLQRKAHQIMSRHLLTARRDTSATDALKLMLDKGVSCLPIVDDRGHCLGIVTTHDLLRLALRAMSPAAAA